MGLFFEVLSAINNPNQQANVDQLSGVMSAIQQLTASNGIQPSAMQSAVSALGGALQPVLKQQAATGGLEGLVSQFAGGNPGLGALSSLLTPQLQQQLIQSVAQKSGISSGVIQAMLPTLLPVVMGLLGMGKPTPGATAKNNILDTFLNPGQAGGADLGNVINFAGRFLNPPR